QGAHPGIAAPRENELVRAAHADELIVDEVGRHADQGEVAPALADDLMAGGKGDQVREPFHGHGVAVVYVLGDRVREYKKARHRLQGEEDGFSVALQDDVVPVDDPTPRR